MCALSTISYMFLAVVINFYIGDYYYCQMY